MNKLPLKIAFLGNQIAWGGGAKSLFLLIKSLSFENIKMYLFVTHCVSGKMKIEFEKYVEFVKVINLPEITSAQTQSVKENTQNINEKKLNIADIESFADELNHLSIDILHVNNSVFAAIYKTIKERTHVKIVSHIREWVDWNGIHEKQRFIIDSIRANSDAIVCISENEAHVFKEHPNITIVSNPFDFNEIGSLHENRESIKEMLGFNNKHFIVGMMGRAQENKGFLDFLKAIAYLKKNHTDVDFIKFIILGGEIPSFFNFGIYWYRKICGKSVFSYDVYKFLKKEDLFKEVLILSNRKNSLEIANTFDVAVRPSYSGDPWGRDIIEYMALKKPIVATGSSEFYVINGETGFLVPPRDYIQLAQKIYLLFKNKTIGIQMGEKAYEQVSNRCEMNIFREEILTIYNSITKT